MKVMSKKLGESICVGSDVVFTLISSRGGIVRVGVKAPLDVPIEHAEQKVPEPPKGDADDPQGSQA